MRPLTDHERWLLGRVAITGLCAYEIYALWADDPRCPPISEILYEASNHKVARFVAWMAGGFALDHIYGD